MTSTCLDPETLALWVENGLSTAERATAERHVADCARCQATLAALVRIAPVPELNRPWWQTLRAAWLAPLVAATAAVVIWIAVPSAPPPPPSPQPASPASTAIASAPEPAPSSPQSVKQEARNAPAAAATPPAVELGRQSVAETLTVAPEVAAPPPSAARAFAGAAADATARSAPQANAVASEIVSPDSMSRWRITGGRAIEHSTDGGATWQAQPTGTASVLTAGAAPSPLICWVVGQDGLVLLSTDGRTWRRLNSPAATALVSVRAADERTATVTDANGRTYATSDAGARWTQP